MSETDWKKELEKLRGSMTPAEPQKDKKGKAKDKKFRQKPPRDKKPAPPHHGDRGGGSGGGKGCPYFLPVDTRQVIMPELGNTRQNVENFALLLNKCARFDDHPKHEKFIFSRDADRRRGVQEYRLNPDFRQVSLADITQRHRKAIQRLNLHGTKEPLELTVDWRLIVGLGGESVYETSMTLHHIYGIPYIPGQAVKGVTRSWMILEKFADEAEALQNKAFCDIFGCDDKSYYKEARQSKVFFFDAFPTNLTNRSIQPDIMNPHYPDYYQGNKPPADYQNPNPITFLTVVDTTFEFFVGVKPEDNTDVTDSKSGAGKLLDIVKEALKSALQDHGIGAKTAVGYGYLSVVNRDRGTTTD